MIAHTMLPSLGRNYLTLLVHSHLLLVESIPDGREMTEEFMMKLWQGQQKYTTLGLNGHLHFFHMIVCETGNILWLCACDPVVQQTSKEFSCCSLEDQQCTLLIGAPARDEHKRQVKASRHFCARISIRVRVHFFLVPLQHCSDLSMMLDVEVSHHGRSCHRLKTLDTRVILFLSISKQKLWLPLNQLDCSVILMTLDIYTFSPLSIRTMTSWR